MRLSDVAFHPQEAHHCGPASLLTVLEAAGIDITYESAVERVFVPGLEGSLQSEMSAAARQFGRIAYSLPPEPAAVLAEVAAGRPVLMLLNLGLPRRPVWHYAVVVGFDPGDNRVLLHSGREAWARWRAGAWLRRWDWAGRWAMVLLRPGEWPAAPDRDRLLAALAAFEDAADPEAAAEAWKSASESWPDEPIAWLGVGNAAHRRGDLAAAREAYRRALALEPEQLPARLNLALSFAAGEACEAFSTLGSLPDGEHSLSATFAELQARLQSECAALAGL